MATRDGGIENVAIERFCVDMEGKEDEEVVDALSLMFTPERDSAASCHSWSPSVPLSNGPPLFHFDMNAVVHVKIRPAAVDARNTPDEPLLFTNVNNRAEPYLTVDILVVDTQE